MARIRTVKPEFWRHEELSSLPAEVHMLAAALLNYADDEGYFNANPKLVQAECCPLREGSVSIHDALNLLVQIGYLRVGQTLDGKRYGHILNFKEHQRINRPTESKISSLDISWEPSSINHPQLTEPSPPERKGREQGTGNGKEGGAAAPDEIVFQGSYVKTIREKDLTGWLERYSSLDRADMLSEIELCDEYHAGSDSPPSKWYFTVSAWLKRAHDGRMKSRRDEEEAERRIYAGVQ